MGFSGLKCFIDLSEGWKLRLGESNWGLQKSIHEPSTAASGDRPPPPKFFLPWIRRITPRRPSHARNRPRGSNSKRSMGPLVRREPLNWWRQALIGSRTAAACAYVPLFSLSTELGRKERERRPQGPWLDAVETRVLGDGCIQSGGVKAGDLEPRSTGLDRPRHRRLASHGRAARRRSKIHPTSPGIRHFHVVVRRGPSSFAVGLPLSECRPREGSARLPRAQIDKHVVEQSVSPFFYHQWLVR